jgi:hypothetical protein
MYLVGTSHPNKERAAMLLARMTSEGGLFATDVEVYQEILHRYVALNRTDFIGPAFALLDSIADEVLVLEMTHIRGARELIASVRSISARDAVHAAIMKSAGISEIFSFDRGFDRCPGISRIS